MTPQPTSRADAVQENALRFSMVNYVVLALALVTILAGFWTLSNGSTVAAPILLSLGFLVLMPVGLIK